jgi:hypothetical protein
VPNLGNSISQLAHALFSRERGHNRGMTAHPCITQISDCIQLLFETIVFGAGQFLKFAST